MSRSFKVLWTKVAGQDLETVVHFIAEENPENAARILRQIRNKSTSLKKNPHRGRKVPEFEEFPDISFREMLIPPWRLIYRVVGSSVEVLAFLDGRRDLEEILYERLMRPDLRQGKIMKAADKYVKKYLFDFRKLAH